MDFLLPYLARYIHIASAITLMGGVFFAAIAWLPALRGGPNELSIGDAIAARFRPWLVGSILGLTVTGFYNYYRHAVRHDVPPLFHMVFGMKFILVLHVFAVSYLAMRPGNTKRARQILGVVISGLIVIGLSAWMRVLHLAFLTHAK
jgi:hypothetical protein